ncbi:MAG: glutathione S-transferase family protein [Gammaproteobacteria bacterium]|nr:glutathione S-transferase family protein [Gammaproteobacteria bacterium]
MQLIGMLDSPYVRRVAITAELLGIPLERRQISVFTNYDEIRAINPLVKVPTLVLDDGRILIDSTLIIDYLEATSGRPSMVPANLAARVDALAAIGMAMAVNEKAVQLYYETKKRPAEAQHAPWLTRVREQIKGGLGCMEAIVGDGESWLGGDAPGQADVTIATAWRFLQLHYADEFAPTSFPGLACFSARAEALPEFRACPVAS